MNFSELDFEALEDIPPLRRHYDVPRQKREWSR